MSHPKNIGNNARIESGPRIIEEVATVEQAHKAMKFSKEKNGMVPGLDSFGNPIVAGKKFKRVARAHEAPEVWHVYKKSQREEALLDENGKFQRDEEGKVKKGMVDFWEKVSVVETQEEAENVAKSL